MINKLRMWWWNLPYYLQPRIRYAVITQISNEGNKYEEILFPRPFSVGINGDGSDVIETRLTTIDGPSDEDFNTPATFARLPVFTMGEILLVNRSGREIAGRGRKPSKWYVECEYFWTRRAAIKRSREVQP